MKACSHGRHHPWHVMRDEHPHITIDLWHELPDGVAGAWIGDTIYLDHRLTQVGRRCTLEHERIHLERQLIPDDPVLVAREEAVVDEIAARNLIPLDILIDGLRWCQGVAGVEMADEVWTDRHTLNVRLATLTADEQQQIRTALEGGE